MAPGSRQAGPDPFSNHNLPHVLNAGVLVNILMVWKLRVMDKTWGEQLVLYTVESLY